MKQDKPGISDEDLQTVHELTQAGKPIPAVIVRGILTRLEAAERNPNFMLRSPQ